MIDARELRLRKEYWEHVRECLVQFHRISPAVAEKTVGEYRQRFPLRSEKPEIELVYHYEPFRLACKITGQKLSVKDFAEEYSTILKTAASYSKQSKSHENNLLAFGSIGSGETIRKVGKVKSSKNSNSTGTTLAKSDSRRASSVSKTSGGKTAAAKRATGGKRTGAAKTGAKKVTASGSSRKKANGKTGKSYK